jgi:hypothetical protein
MDCLDFSQKTFLFKLKQFAANLYLMGFIIAFVSIRFIFTAIFEAELMHHYALIFFLLELLELFMFEHPSFLVFIFSICFYQN